MDRRDNKNRVLNKGESQRKDGRYEYTYMTDTGKQKKLYSWRLVATDKVPKGKRDCVPLREKIAMIEKDKRDGIAYSRGDVSVLELVEIYLKQKTGVTHNTRSGYKTVLKVLSREKFGKKKIKDVKMSAAKQFLAELQAKGKGYSSIQNIRGVLKPAFTMAVNDDMLWKNPFDFALREVVVNDMVPREAITNEEKERFLEFVKYDEHYSRYYEGIVILFETGMRISEFVGLTLSDVDMEKREIHIDHQLQRKRNMEYIVMETKTQNGKRVLPMTTVVYECFKKIIERRGKNALGPEIDGRVGFLYLDKNQKPLVALHWEHYFKAICNKYKKTHTDELPRITPHVCRHTYCTAMVEKGVNPKVLQILMGHAEVSTTLAVYTHIHKETLWEEVKRIEDL